MADRLGRPVVRRAGVASSTSPPRFSPSPCCAWPHRRPDEEHPYGFSKAEYFAAGIEGALIVLAAAGILATAIPRLLRPEALEAPVLGLGVSAIATLINFGIAIVLLRVGQTP